MIFRKALLTAAAALAIFALSSVARADTVTLVSVFNSTGLTAQVSNYSLVGNTFTFTINNTSVAPDPASVITNIGFNLTGERPNTYTLGSSTNASYFVVHDLDSNLPGVNFDFVLMNRQPTSPDPIQFGVGSIANGIQSGQSATFAVTGDFSGMTADRIARSIFARFQNGTPFGSDIVTAAQTPEPMTLLLFGTGLAGVAARLRRRKRTGE